MFSARAAAPRDESLGTDFGVRGREPQGPLRSHAPIRTSASSRRRAAIQRPQWAWQKCPPSGQPTFHGPSCRTDRECPPAPPISLNDQPGGSFAQFSTGSYEYAPPPTVAMPWFPCSLPRGACHEARGSTSSGALQHPPCRLTAKCHGYGGEGNDWGCFPKRLRGMADALDRVKHFAIGFAHRTSNPKASSRG
jgi:hypothetical protein